MINIDTLKEYGVNPYRLLNPHQKIEYRNKEYCDLLFGIACSIIHYDKSEEYSNIDDSTIEKILILNGTGAFYKVNNEINFGFCSEGGKLDNNGIGTIRSIYSLNGTGCVRGSDNSVVGYNNITRTPDMTILRYSDMFSEVDLSQLNNIQYTRIYPLYVAKNRKIADSIKNFFKGLKMGDSVKVADDSILGNKDTIQAINITDVASIDKLQYLSTYHNDLLRRWFTMHGIALSEGMKLSQQSVEEISSNIPYSMCLPLQMLKEREKMCEKVEKLFGGKIRPYFSEIVETKYKKWKENTNNDDVK